MDRRMLRAELREIDLYIRQIRSTGKSLIVTSNDEALLNYQRQSTTGWSIYNILLVVHI